MSDIENTKVAETNDVSVSVPAEASNKIEVMDNNTDHVKLIKPLADGTNELIFDFDRLNGYSLIKCEKTAKKMDPSISVLSLSQVYQAQVAAVAACVKIDDIYSLSGKDFTLVTLKVQNFLLGAANGEQETSD